MTATFYSIGIDPGVNGGICILSPDRKIVAITAMPETELGIWMWVKNQYARFNSGPFKACIERVGGYIPRDRSGKNRKDKGDRGSHMFIFGQSYGALRMALLVLNIHPYLEVVPSVWQRGLSISPRDKDREDGNAFKRRIKERAQELFPGDSRVTLKTCDAVLLAYYLSTR